jgi:predicted DNA-binding protein
MALAHTHLEGCNAMTMKRTTIWLSDEQVKLLAKLAKKKGMKQAELIRRFIDAGLKEE